MRILVLCHEFPPVGGGAAAVCAALSNEYVLAGHEVCVVTMAWENLPPEETIDGVQVVRVPCGRKKVEMASAWEALTWAISSKAVIEKLHAEKPFDITHAHFIMPGGIPALSLLKSHGVPYIITSHGTDVPGYNRERMRLAHLLARPWWKRIVRQAAQVVFLSQSLLKLMRKTIDPPQCVVIPNGFRPGRFNPETKKRRILLCSRLVERKGFQYFLSAIEDLELPGWEVDLVGDGPMYQQLCEQAKKCKIPVHMHGWMNNDDPRLTELYDRALIYVFPSEWENFSVALLEGMSAACAVITTNISGNPEVVGDTGFLVPPRDPDALRAALLELTSDEGRCQKLGEFAKERVWNELHWEQITQRYLALMEQQLPSLATSR